MTQHTIEMICIAAALAISAFSLLFYLLGCRQGKRELKAAEWTKLISEYQKEVVRVRELALDADRGTLDVAFDGPAVKIFAAKMVQWFRKEGGKNYVTMDLFDPATGDRYSITMQRAGGTTPAQALYEMHKKLEAAGIQ